MPNLVLELKSGESLLINGAALRFRTRTRLELTSRARFLFGRQIMTEAEAVTPARRLYHALQRAYVGREDEREAALDTALALLDEARRARAGSAAAEVLDELRVSIEEAGCYRALKLARRLIADEERPAASARHGDDEGRVA